MRLDPRDYKSSAAVRRTVRLQAGEGRLGLGHQFFALVHLGLDDLARALEAADTAALRALDPVLAGELQVSGRAPWQVLAGAAENTPFTGALLHEDAPYGVGYLVATWSRP